MEQLPTLSGRAIGAAFAARRKGLGHTQQHIANEIGAARAQSQISAFEKGNAHALSDARVHAYARLIGLDLDALGIPGVQAVPDNARALSVCAHLECPGNTALIGPAGSVVMIPAFRHTDDARCCMCGEAQILRCEHPECGAPIARGLHCSRCGNAYVQPPSHEYLMEVQMTAPQWALAHRELSEGVQHILDASMPRFD